MIIRIGFSTTDLVIFGIIILMIIIAYFGAKLEEKRENKNNRQK